MEQKTERLYPYAPLKNKNDDLEWRLQKRLIDANSFNNSNKNIKEVITYFKDKTINQKRNINNRKR